MLCDAVPLVAVIVRMYVPAGVPGSVLAPPPEPPDPPPQEHIPMTAIRRTETTIIAVSLLRLRLKLPPIRVNPNTTPTHSVNRIAGSLNIAWCGAVVVTASVAVLEEESLSCTELTEHDASDIEYGTTQEKLTVPLNPLCGAIVKVFEAEPPRLTTRSLVLTGVIEKSRITRVIAGDVADEWLESPA